MCIGNTYFKDKHMYQYTTAARGQDRMEVISMIDQVLVKEIC